MRAENIMLFPETSRPVTSHNGGSVGFNILNQIRLQWALVPRLGTE